MCVPPSNPSDPYDPYEKVGPFPDDPHPPSAPHTNVTSNPLYQPDEQDGPQIWLNPHYNRLAQSDEPVPSIGSLANPNDYGPHPDIVHGGSLPHVAYNGPMTNATYLRVRTNTDLA